MPLTAKGNEIMEAMKKSYGAEGERIFYASRNAGVISGVDSEYELTGKSIFNLDNMAEQISSLGSEAKRLAERMDSTTRGEVERLIQKLEGKGMTVKSNKDRDGYLVGVTVDGRYFDNIISFAEWARPR